MNTLTKLCACGDYHEVSHPHFGTMYTAAGNDPGVRVIVLINQVTELRAENEKLKGALSDCVREIQELMAGTTLLSWSVPQARAILAKAEEVQP